MGAKDLFRGTGPVVTVIDRATGKVENAVLPRFPQPESKALWKPLFDQIRERMARRGLEKKMMLGMINDAWPTAEEIAFFADVAPDLRWAVAAHGIYGKASLGYQSIVYCKYPKDKSLTSLLGWTRPDLLSYYNRDNELGNAEPAKWRMIPELAITGDQRGVGHIGADFWKVLRNKKGQRAMRIYSRYPESGWLNLDIYTALLAPAPEGVAVTGRYENLREGIQECEARIAIERVLSDDTLKRKLDAALVARCQKVLEDRLQNLQLGWSKYPRQTIGSVWYFGSGWQQRAEELFTLAGEVEKAR
jgi:hypothetical protein